MIVKNDKIIVIIIIDIFCQAPIPIGITLFNTGANLDANASDANALDKNPANVIPICIVDKNLLGVSSIFCICCAFLFPSFACFSILASFKAIYAISLAAKNAFKAINITNTNICVIIYKIFLLMCLSSIYCITTSHN